MFCQSPSTSEASLAAFAHAHAKAGAGLLSQAGIKTLSVVGGTAAWVKAGHPVVVGSRPI